MKIFRKVIFWCHLITGVTAALVILIMSFTGVLLTYEKQIVVWADSGLRGAPPAPGAARLSMETLISRLREAQPQAHPVAITARSDSSAGVAIAVNGDRTFYLNPYTGDILGEGSKSIRNFFRLITDWHRWLGAHGENRAAARAITGACNLGFLFLVISGLYIWFPRNLSWAAVKNVLWFRRGLNSKARDFNWHNVIGFWMLAPLFIVVLSATVISYPWASNLVYRLAGEAPPAPRGAAPPPQQGGPRESPRFDPAVFSGLDQAWASAEQHNTGWRTISLRLPNSTAAPLSFTVDHGSGGQPQKRAQLTRDRKTGEVARWEPFSGFSPGRKWRSILRFAHTGEVGGVIGQTIAGVASAGGVMLVYTGLALALRRFRAWLQRRSRVAVPINETAD
jgi:uncharacterized iron-regulated membrane protein